MVQNIVFKSLESRKDFENMLKRLSSAGKPECVLKVRGETLLVYGCTQAPEGLLDATETVLVQRAFSVKMSDDIDKVVQLRAFLDRFPRLGSADTEIPLPPEDLQVSWAGVLPPKTGWSECLVIDADSLREVAKQGVERVNNLLPKDPGNSIVKSVRRSVWGLEILPGLKAAAAFASWSMGFLNDAQKVRFLESTTWKRLQTQNGNVFIR